jgi:HK97 gp10 family phage protein
MSQVVWKDWNPQRVKATIAGQVAQNMETACVFVVSRAKELAPRRTGLTISETDFVVEVGARGNVIEGIVGVKRGKAFYARFVELGTRKMAAHPFLRSAVFNNASEIVRIIAGR